MLVTYPQARNRHVSALWRPRDRLRQRDLSWACTIHLATTAKRTASNPPALPVPGEGKSPRRLSRPSSRRWQRTSRSADRATDKRTRRALRRLVEFAAAEGLPLDREVILDPDSVERFVEVALARGALSGHLPLHVAPRALHCLQPRRPGSLDPPRLHRRALVAPYNEVEVKILCEDAALQPGESRRRAALGLLALGLGAGLDGRWVAKVRASDVVKRGRFVIVSVGRAGGPLVWLFAPNGSMPCSSLPQVPEGRSFSGVDRSPRIGPRT